MQTIIDEHLPNGLGRRHGTSRSEAFDRWFRYPAGFASDTVADLFARTRLNKGETIIDPFAGVGVAGTIAAAQGFRFFGIEAHPLAAELANLKLTNPPQGPSNLLEVADQVTDNARCRISTMNIVIDSEASLVRRSFAKETLLQLLAIRDSIHLADREELWMKWALLGTLRDVASVRVGWPYQRPGKPRQAPVSDVFTRFRQRVAWMVEDVQRMKPGQLNENTDQLDSRDQAMHQIICGDSRLPDSWNALGDPAAACVSSPPYLNNFDYADATRLELYFLGEITTWADMCKTVRQKMLIATTQQTKVSQSEEAWSFLKKYPQNYNKLRQLGDELSTRRKERPRGKEYDRVLPCYFAGIAQVLSQLAQALRPGANCYWLVGDSAPYGVYVDTPKLIGGLGEEFGLQTMADVAIRRRGSRWASNGTRHQVPLAERLLVMRSSATEP
jgi:DNA modification methylase